MEDVGGCDLHVLLRRALHGGEDRLHDVLVDHGLEGRAGVQVGLRARHQRLRRDHRVIASEAKEAFGLSPETFYVDMYILAIV